MARDKSNKRMWRTRLAQLLRSVPILSMEACSLSRDRTPTRAASTCAAAASPRTAVVLGRPGHGVAPSIAGTCECSAACTPQCVQTEPSTYLPPFWGRTVLAIVVRPDVLPRGWHPLADHARVALVARPAQATLNT